MLQAPFPTVREALPSGPNLLHVQQGTAKTFGHQMSWSVSAGGMKEQRGANSIFSHLGQRQRNVDRLPMLHRWLLPADLP
jgi:hypothetical protein